MTHVLVLAAILAAFIALSVVLVWYALHPYGAAPEHASDWSGPRHAGGPLGRRRRRRAARAVRARLADRLVAVRARWEQRVAS